MCTLQIKNNNFVESIHIMLKLCLLCYHSVPGPVTSFQLRQPTSIFGLIITWGSPSGSNYPTPVTYQLRYREKPSSGSPGGWSSTVQRTATQRQYTTPVLKPSTRYEVEVWAVSTLGDGQSISRTTNTRQCMYLQDNVYHTAN